MPDQLCQRIRQKHYSLNTDNTYQFDLVFVLRWSANQAAAMQHPREMSVAEVEACLPSAKNELANWRCHPHRPERPGPGGAARSRIAHPQNTERHPALDGDGSLARHPAAAHRKHLVNKTIGLRAAFAGQLH